MSSLFRNENENHKAHTFENLVELQVLLFKGSYPRVIPFTGTLHILIGGGPESIDVRQLAVERERGYMGFVVGVTRGYK